MPRRGCSAAPPPVVCIGSATCLLTRPAASLGLSRRPLPPRAPPPAAGHLLSRTVRKWKDKVKLRGWPHKVPALFSASRAAAHPLPRSPPMPVRLPVHSPCMALTPTVQHSAAVPRMFGPAGIHAQHPSSVQASAPCVSLRGEGATATSTPVRAACPLCEQHLRSAFPDVTTCLGVPFSPSPRARAGVERGHE